MRPEINHAMRPNLLIDEVETQSCVTASAPLSTIEALDDALIAGFTPVEIARMTDDELVRAIRAARLPLRAGTDEHLAFHDRRTLERLAYLARRCCQTRTSGAIVQQAFVNGGE